MAPQILPPPFASEPPGLVEFDASAALFNAVPTDQADTWRPTGFESDSPEAIA
jgi:hypothetical protein